MSKSKVAQIENDVQSESRIRAAMPSARFRKIAAIGGDQGDDAMSGGLDGFLTPQAEFAGTILEARRELAKLWYIARDQASENPVFDWESCRKTIDNAAAELSMQLNSIEDLFERARSREAVK